MASQGQWDRASLIRYRLERAADTLRDARLLAEGGGTPSSIVNRAYYAMFYAVMALLAHEGLSASRHGQVIALFDRVFVKSGRFPKAMSKALHRAFEWRQTSDYRDFRTPSQEEALEVLRLAQNFVQAVQQYFAHHNLL